MKRREFLISGGAAILLLQSRVSLFGSVQAKIQPNILFIDLEPLSHLSNADLYPGEKLNIPGLKRLMENGDSVKKSLSYHPENPAYRAFHVGNWDMPGKSAREYFTVLHEGGWCGELNDQDVTSGARSFLRNYKEPDPFFLSVAYFKPGESHLLNEESHLPNGESHLPNEESHLPNEESHLPNEEDYLRSVERIDLEIELLLQEVERSQWSENTIILYAWAHGKGIECLLSEQEES